MAPPSAVNPCEGEYRFKKLQDASKDDIKVKHTHTSVFLLAIEDKVFLLEFELQVKMLLFSSLCVTYISVIFPV